MTLTDVKQQLQDGIKNDQIFIYKLFRLMNKKQDAILKNVRCKKIRKYRACIL